MEFKITGPGGVKQTDKSKKTAKAGQNTIDGPSFASVLAETDASTAATATAAPDAVLPPLPNPDYLDASTLPSATIPQEPKAHGEYLLHQLEDLQADILNGSPTAAVTNLQRALEHSPLASPLAQADLTPQQREILAELHLRAAVEVAKAHGNVATDDETDPQP